MNYKLEHFVRRLSDGKVLPVVARVNEGEPE
jgi:hypothetical protein